LENRFERDLSQGNVARQLLIFAWPFILSNLIQALYNVADMIIVGNFCGAASMSGVNIGGQVTLLLTNMVVGLSVGGTVLIGQFKGRNDKESMRQIIGTLFTTLLVLGIFMTVIMILLRQPILRLINTPEQSFEQADAYLIITTLGTLFIFGYNALSAVMRGMGDSKHPLMFVGVACVTNIVLDLLFVGPFNMRAQGAALATIISQALSMILCIWYMKRHDFIFDFKLSSFRFYGSRLGMLLRVGIPTSVQNVITNLSFLFITALVNTFGVDASAAVGAIGKFNSFAILPAIAMSSSISAMVAQNLGANKQDRAVQTMRTGMVMAIVMSWAMFAIAQLFPAQILRLFADDPKMVELGIPYLRTFSFDYLIVPMLFSLNGLNIGAGHTTFSLINTCLSSLLFRIPFSYIFGMVLNLGLWGVGIGGPAASAAALITAVWFYLSGRWKRQVVFTPAES
jgi:putative MATE family efflux protein